MKNPDSEDLNQALIKRYNKWLSDAVLSSETNLKSITDCYSISLDYVSSKEILKLSFKHSCRLVIDAAICISFNYFFPIMSALVSGCSIMPILMQISAWIIQSPFTFMAYSILTGSSLFETNFSIVTALSVFLTYLIVVPFTQCLVKLSMMAMGLLIYGKKNGLGNFKIKIDFQFLKDCFFALVKLSILWLKQAVLLMPMPVIFLLRAIHCALCLTLQTVSQVASYSASAACRLFNAAPSALSSSVSSPVPQQAACS